MCHRTTASPTSAATQRTDCLAPPRDEGALADAIVRLFQDNEVRQQLGANGKQKLDGECFAHAMDYDTLAVYHCAISGGRSGAGSRKPTGHRPMHTSSNEASSGLAHAFAGSCSNEASIQRSVVTLRIPYGFVRPVIGPAITKKRSPRGRQDRRTSSNQLLSDG